MQNIEESWKNIALFASQHISQTSKCRLFHHLTVKIMNFVYMGMMQYIWEQTEEISRPGEEKKKKSEKFMPKHKSL